MSLELIALYAGRNEIEDEGIKVLKKAFITDGFAPRLQILWLSVNLITDTRAKRLKVRFWPFHNFWKKLFSCNVFFQL